MDYSPVGVSKKAHLSCALLPTAAILTAGRGSLPGADPVSAGGIMVFLALFWFLHPLLRLFREKHELNSEELLVVCVMPVVTSCTAAMGFVAPLLPVTALPFYFTAAVSAGLSVFIMRRFPLRLFQPIGFTAGPATGPGGMVLNRFNHRAYRQFRFLGLEIGGDLR